MLDNTDADLEVFHLRLWFPVELRLSRLADYIISTYRFRRTMEKGSVSNFFILWPRSFSRRRAVIIWHVNLRERESYLTAAGMPGR